LFKPLLGDPTIQPTVHKWRGEKAQKLIYTSDSAQLTRNIEARARS